MKYIYENAIDRDTYNWILSNILGTVSLYKTITITGNVMRKYSMQAKINFHPKHFFL